jgi:hypothetical protein
MIYSQYRFFSNTVYLLIFSTFIWYLLFWDNKEIHAQKRPSVKDHELIRKSEETEQLKTDLEESQRLLEGTLKELEKKESLIKSLEAEKDAAELQKTLRIYNENLIAQELFYKSRDLNRIRGNLLYPGAGRIYNKEPLGYIWAATFTISLFATVFQYQDAMQKQKTMNSNRMNPVVFESARSAYLQSYNKASMFSVLSLSIYGGSLAEAAFFAPDYPKPTAPISSFYSKPEKTFVIGYTLQF